MSSNQKQTAAVGPQTQRFSATTYQPIPPGPSGPDFYRPEGYPAPTAPTYAPPPPQGGNQASGLRGSSGPPNQSSTPPNAPELKVSAIPQQASMPMFTTVRPPQTFYARTAGPPSQPPRMANHNTRPQPSVFTSSQPQYMHLPTAQMYHLSTNTVPYTYNSQRPTAGFVPQVPVHQFHIPYPYGTTPPQTQPVSYNYFPQMMQRTNTIPQAAAANPNTTQNPLPNVPLVPNTPHQFQRQPPNKKRARALAIIDPDTGHDRLQEMFEDSSQPPSGESSARQTPQPSAVQSHNKQVQAAFAQQVLQAINDNTTTPIEHHKYTPTQPQDVHHSDLQTDIGSHQAIHVEYDQSHTSRPPHQVQQQHQIKMDHVVQSSKLQAEAKEFILPQTAKETPIVSANIDAVEVTLPNKLPKDRESPVKGRKQRSNDFNNKESAKEILSDNKESSSSKDEVKCSVELSTPSTISPPTNTTQVPVVSKDSSVASKDSIAQSQDNKHRPPQHQQQQQKKDTSAKSVERQDSTGSTGSNIVAAQEVKSKQNAQKSASKQGSGAPNNNQKSTNPVVVPPPQPAKPASKSNKKNELNLKGANKEGTDMDAFNDNALREEVNSNVIPTQVVNNNDIINANSLPLTANNTTTPTQIQMAGDVNVNTETNNKILDNDISKTADSVTKPTPKNKVGVTDVVRPKPENINKSFDVTNIVRDLPKNIKPYNSSTISQDEPDRAALTQSNEKIMVQAKNDVNAKTSENNRIDNKLPYADGQWSPANQNGLMKYPIDFLLALKDTPASKVPPANILDAVVADVRGRLSDSRSSMGGRTDFNPSFNYGRNSSQKGPLPSRLSGSKMDRGKGNKGSTAKPAMKVSISVREEVKLHESENAWRPARLVKGEVSTDEDKKTEELYRKVRGILNKLTPQKFDTLLQQIRSLAIDTEPKLQGVIDLVFEKAVDEPNFSVAYAGMCGHLALLQVPCQNSAEKSDFVNFRKLLVTRCQVEFEKQSVDEKIKATKLKEIEACTDPEKRKDLQFELEEYFRRVRMKSVGNTRFIGELFKQNMLTQNIMMRCLNMLLENGDEESLECLCKLLTTIGKELDNKNVPLTTIFEQMKNLANKKESSKISSRIRFMLQDVIDLRNSKWVPRRQDLNPKMIDQIQKEAEQEQLNIQMMNSVPMTPRKDDRSGGSNQGSMNDRKGGRGSNRNVSDEGWINVNNRGKTTFSVQSDKLKAGKTHVGGDEQLGSSQMFFSKWHTGSGSNVKSTTHQVPNTANMYAALENIEADRRMNIRPGQKESYHSKGASLERANYKYDSRGGSRSGSQHRSGDSSASSSQRGTPAPMPSLPPHFQPQQQAPPRTQPVAPTATTTYQIESLNEDQRNRRIRNSLDEYINDNCSVDEFFTEIVGTVPPECFAGMISESYIHILEKSSLARLKTGGLFAKLIVQGKISIEDYCAGLEELLSQADDLKIDIPKIWDYLAEILVYLICEEALPLKRLHKCMEILIQQKQADKLLVPLFNLVISNKGSNFLQNQWLLSHLQISDFMHQSQVDSFIRDNKFEFLLGGPSPVAVNSISYPEVQTKLLNFLKADRNIDDIHDWVTTNVGDQGIKENKFIRALATAIFEDSINKNHKLSDARLEQHNMLLIKYVDSNPGFELECLYALQALVQQMEHPQGLLLQIFNKLYEGGTISQESFIAWEQSQDPAEQEGKGVALKQLTSFFCQLKENDDDDESSVSEPDGE